MAVIKIENVVASTSLGGELDLQAIALALDGAEYEPEQFPGLVYRIDEPKVVALLFGSGKIVCTGAKKVSDMCDSFHMKCELEGWGPATGQFATLQIAGCCRNTDVFEKMEPGEAYDMCVKDTVKIDREGFVHMPTKPGLGLDLIWMR
jgi:hypothetical protein